MGHFLGAPEGGAEHLVVQDLQALAVLHRQEADVRQPLLDAPDHLQMTRTLIRVLHPIGWTEPAATSVSQTLPWELSYLDEANVSCSPHLVLSPRVEGACRCAHIAVHAAARGAVHHSALCHALSRLCIGQAHICQLQVAQSCTLTGHPPTQAHRRCSLLQAQTDECPLGSAWT